MITKKTFVILFCFLFALTTGYTGTAIATDEKPATEPTGEAEWAAKAAKVVETQMAEDFDKQIPSTLLQKSQCVAVFPSVLKAGFIVGAKRGDGLISCRHKETGEWGAPAFFRITGVSWGLQIGAKSADVILLVMNQKGIDGILKSKVSLGGDIGVTAGPVGRDAAVGTDVLLKSSVISYARSKGIFAGLNLEGSTITYNDTANTKVYGKDADARKILFDVKAIPESVKVLHDTLKKHAPKPETKEQK